MRYKITVLTPVYNQEELVIKAIESVPVEWKAEHIVVDDGSTDDTRKEVENYIESHSERDVKLFGWNDNKGVSYALNKGLDEATGDYIVFLGSDDTFLPEIDEVAKRINGEDLIYYDLVDNNGHVRKLSKLTRGKYVGAVKFMRREFIGDIRFPLNRRRAEDVPFTHQLIAKKPKECYTNIIAKHYNYPREGSLTWNARHGVTDKYGF